MVTSIDQLLDLPDEEAPKHHGFHTILCPLGGTYLGFDMCQQSDLLALKHIALKLDAAITGLIVIADAIAANLLELEENLGLIHNSLAEEAEMIMQAREAREASSNGLWHWLGWHSGRYRHLESRLLTVNSIRDCQREASQGVGGMRGGLRRVAKELKVFKQVVMGFIEAEEKISPKGFANILRLNLLRLREGREGLKHRIAQ